MQRDVDRVTLHSAAEKAAEPAGAVTERPGHTLAADLEGAQNARSGALEVVQDAAVGLAEIDRDQGEAHDREHGDNRCCPGDGARASGLRGRAGTGGRCTDRRHAH